jgi:hypothetical protein
MIALCTGLNYLIDFDLLLMITPCFYKKLPLAAQAQSVRRNSATHGVFKKSVIAQDRLTGPSSGQAAINSQLRHPKLLACHSRAALGGRFEQLWLIANRDRNLLT